ncbi:DUF7289 family protein [Methanoregula formicica]|uniref:Archaeal flagellin-like protein n=1 Tax=Methanoregula formicica (strain DSM 22288 / NBRC 105244 / SMSP) TaxID=593750 RepID=L0HAU2_METFS|nr:hypothetical protein [Methanoregula formicica]AGB01125.1 hypothetical protein Metfor_0038 [Methanoregula formicica SMSP]
MTTRAFQESCTDGVSESIGFLLIFTLMMAGIGLVTLYGYPLLMQQQTGADEQIMEKNMIVLQNDVKSLAYKTVPYKETALKIGGGSLTVFNSSTTPQVFTISIHDSSTTYVNEFHPGDLRYVSESARTDLSLQNGAVVKRDRAGQGSVMLAEPRWFYDSAANMMVINLISFNSTDLMGRSGIGMVQMALKDNSYSSIPVPATTTVLLDYTSPDPTDADFSIAWDNYFTNTVKMERQSSAAGPTITYKLPLDSTRDGTLVIKKYDILIKSV